MPIEIREIVIKTEVQAHGPGKPSGPRDREWQAFKRQLLEECRRMLSAQTRQERSRR
jgi:hypothetical protein